MKMLRPGQLRWLKAQQAAYDKFPPLYSKLCKANSECTKRCIHGLIPNFRTERHFAKQWIPLLRLRDGDLCHYCRRPVCFDIFETGGLPLATVDHVVPVLMGGTDEMSNLVLSCWNCNSAKQSRSYEWMINHIQKSK